MILLLFCFATSQVHLGLTEERQFLQWMRANNQFYTGDDYHLRLGVFISNLRFYREFNKIKGRTYTIGVNKFSCHTPSEYKSLLGVRDYNQISIKRTRPQSRKTAPDSFDWREHGVVNPIKNQGNCGSCWAFSTISTSESAYAIKHGQLLHFSEQNLVDCATTCKGCNYGWPDKALTYIINNQSGQFSSENEYPYSGVEGECHFAPQTSIGKVNRYIEVERSSEDDLKEKVANYGVASICIAAGNAKFMSYTGGILDDPDCNVIDHAVNAVGYGSEDGIDFWIVRNSWGTAWGEDGYVRMIRNKHNRCLVATRAVVAIVDE